MAVIKSPTLFFVTSPRTPFKMRPEIKLLTDAYAGQRWNGNTALQAGFMKRLAAMPEFEGAVNQNNPALSARDRITRGPKALGFVALDKIALTPAGRSFLDDDTAEEMLLRQLLKFQLPSPFHKANPRIPRTFCVRPYLEMLRLVSTLGRLEFDELCLFGMRLTDYRHFGEIVAEIKAFRTEKEKQKGHYRQFLNETRQRIVSETFRQEIAAGKIKTRETAQATLDKSIRTKAGNLRDYADACLRYLRATGLVTISSPGRTISIIESRRDEVAFILKNIRRAPDNVDDEKAYCANLFNDATPRLLTDERKALVAKAMACRAVASKREASAMALTELKRRLRQVLASRKEAVIQAQVTELKSFTKYAEIIDVFGHIVNKDIYDPPLALEWNTWRAMTMMDGGRIVANLNFDDAGNPLATAPGNAADIVCDYGDFLLTVEVTMLAGSRQYDAEAEPMARHLGDLKAKTGKEAYCLFIAPTINESTISHFYMLHRTKIRHYGGKSVVIPLTLHRFMGMLSKAKDCGYVPEPERIKAFCEFSRQAAAKAEDEVAWYAAVSAKADAWLG